MQNIRNNYIFHCCNDIYNICSTLFKTTPISYFHWMKSYNDGRYTTLTHHAAWLNYYFDNEYYKISNYRGKTDDYQQNYILTSGLKTGSKIVQAASEGFNIDQGITIVKKYDEGCEFYIFSASREHSNHIVQYYINNLDLLEKFILFFKDSGKKIIRKAENNKFYLPKEKKTYTFDQKKNAVADFPHSRFYFGNNRDDYLTIIQVQYLALVAEGKSSKEIAVILGKSQRTIEKQLEVIKQKTACYKLAQLVVFAKNHKFI